jgi:predicted RNase H-like HicB family nuclease
MELSVLIQRTAGNGYRAWCGEPLAASAEGATREEALEKLRAALEQLTREVEVVRLMIGPVATTPVWPNDEVTSDWLAGIAAARAAAE